MTLDAPTAALAEQIQSIGLPLYYELTPEQARAQLAAGRDRMPAGPQVRAIRTESVRSSGGTGFDIRIYSHESAPTGVIVYYHGGGWVLGSLDEFDSTARHIAVLTGAAVALVDYRLAPENPFPAAPEDAWSALLWVDANMEMVAGRRVPIVVAGDSAGGNLAAVVTQRASRIGGPVIALQALVYPATDSDFTRASYLAPENQLSLNLNAIHWFWDHYAPNLADRVTALAAPIRTTDLSGLPPAIVLTAEHDVLRDEGEEYAQALAEAGVSVDFRRFDGQMHGFFTMHGVLPGATAATEWLCARVVHHLGCAASAS
ncbi:alpha/beta hydrolase [Nocardia sp. NPDC057272]|uniref:alpha/beta hydrolase n=1 Tax=Nocardia sp. NPDC057272 TaxID=3346079 RepID=UPI003625BCE7